MATKKIPQATQKTKKPGLSAVETKTVTESLKGTDATRLTIVESAPALVEAPQPADVTPVGAEVAQAADAQQVAPEAAPVAAIEAPQGEVTPANVEAAPVAVPVIAELPISTVKLDGGTQSRASLSTATIAEYAEQMSNGATFPPIVVFYDGKTRWLADGFHRTHASIKLGRDRIACEVRQGSQRDAILFSVAANATHGLRRTNADKRHAVTLLLADAKWSKKSDRFIAEACGVAHPFVAKVRAQVVTVTTSETETREGRDGKQQAAAKSKAKPNEPARVASAPPVALAVVFAPADQASALADLESDLGRHLLAWACAPEAFAALLEAYATRARGQSVTKEAANG